MDAAAGQTNSHPLAQLTPRIPLPACLATRADAPRRQTMAGYVPAAKSRFACPAAATPRAHSEGKEAPLLPPDNAAAEWRISSTRIPQGPLAPALTLAAVAEEPLPAHIAPSAAQGRCGSPLPPDSFLPLG